MRIGHRLSLVVLVVLAVAGMSPQSSRASHEPMELAAGSTPRTDGQTVVWSDNDGVYAAHLPDRAVFPVAADDNSDPGSRLTRVSADVSGDIVIWEEYVKFDPGSEHRIKGKYLSTGQVFTIANVIYSAMPRISGTFVVWADGAQQQLLGRDVASMNPPVVVASSTPSDDPRAESEMGAPQIDGDRIVWSELYITNLDTETVTSWRILTKRLNDAAPVLLDRGTQNPYQGLGYLFGYTVAGEHVAWGVDQTLNVFDAADGQAHAISVAPSYALLSASDGRYVFFSDGSQANRNELRLDLRGYDLLTDSSFAVVFDLGYNVSADVGHGLLVWQRGVNDTTVEVAHISDTLPSAPRPAAGSTDASHRYFSETGHDLILGFKGYWDANGGLPVFGYPLTEEFEEYNANRDAFQTVQYFERQRFELHPENQGTPYEVLLGRLGAEAAAARALTTTPPFQPADPIASHSDCTFFAATSHWVCGKILAYWKAHGVDFGDVGTSFRESLALFGFPLSEPFTDPDTGLTVQYFERAVLEEHPENANTPYEVLLRRLGASALATKGWPS